MTTPAPIASLTQKVRIAYHQLRLQDRVDIDWRADHRPEDTEIVPGYLSQGNNFLLIQSPGHTLRVKLRLQSWSNEPPLDKERWEIYADANIQLATGFIIPTTPISEGGAEWLRVGQAGGTFRARVYCRGRSRLQEIGDDFDIAEIQEEYLAQFWPADMHSGS